MFFQFKITTWEEVVVPEKHEELILSKIKSGEITSSNDIFNEIDGAHMEIITDAEEQLSVEENEGRPTIEVIDKDTRETIYTNVNERFSILTTTKQNDPEGNVQDIIILWDNEITAPIGLDASHIDQLESFVHPYTGETIFYDNIKCL